MTRRLTDLMQVGKELVFGDEEEETISVYLRKLTPIDLQAQIKHANAARSRARSRFRDEESDDFLSAMSNTEAMGREAAIEFLLALNTGELVEKYESMVADEDEWKKESYLDGLRDAWSDGLEEVYFSTEEGDPEREDAARVFAEQKRFVDQVEAHVSSELEEQRAVLEGRDEEWLFKEATRKSLESEAEQAWLTAYNEAKIYYGVRDAKLHNKRYFESMDEVRNLSSAMVNRILQEFAGLEVDPQEGKGSGEAPTS